MLFNKHIETWKDFLKPNKSYYIANGRLDRVNPNYSSVHKEVELAFTNNTIINETDHEISIQKFSNGFSSLDNADKLPNGAILDLICVLVLVNPLIQNATSKRQEIVVTNELMEHTSVTLWGDFTENDGAFLKNLKDDKLILGLCDVRVSIYKGRFGISTIPVSNVLINRMFEKATDLRAWYITLFTNLSSLVHILDGLLADSQDYMYKFKATIINILNKDEPWYLSCKTCHKKVKVIEEAAACTNCNVDNVDYEMRYCLRLEVCGGKQRAQVILFEATKYLLGFNVQEYIQSTFVKSHVYLTGNLPRNIFNCLHHIKKEECHNYHKLVLSKDKQFNFLVRIDLTDSNPRRSLISEQVHQVEDEAPIIVEKEVKSVRKYRRRAKKTTNAAAQMNVKKPKADKN
ncbi:hypothetical protein H5410_052145 [Solanum commersonii]|uniref:Replication factor A C-terminal domain-containing protein n=1 Tax=Solanum commersonii TaxID=4109 RepID=A0A9J5X2S6_SOLCO|nr:hypothetical protein H5410_052145 [Solanum commersonii]